MIPSTRRGLSTMRTHISRRMSASRQPHEIYMKLTALEIERSRRNTERAAMENRMKMLDERLGDIANEQAELNALLVRAGQTGSEQGLVRGDKPNSNAGNLRY